MKGGTMTRLLTVLFLCFGSVANAQTPAPAEAPLAIVKHSWTKERINWEADPFGGPVENFDDVRRRVVDQRRVERARGAGNTGEAAKVEREMRAEQVIRSRPPAPPRYTFHYKVSVTNTSEKTIRAIDWDYIFFSSNTQSETGRLEFTNEEKIGPGKSKELHVMARKPPAKTVSVYALDKSERQGLDGQVVVMRIEYTDGSVWQRP
jgi:hypothetical protein